MNVFEERQSPEVRNVFARKAHIFEEVESLLQSRGNQIIAALRKVANKKFKRGAGVEPVLDVPRRHREFVEVGEQPRKWSAWKHLPEQIMPGYGEGQTERSPSKKRGEMAPLPQAAALL